MTDFEPGPDPIDADYSAWNADSVVELHSVAWNNDYRDIVDWKDVSTRTTWFESRAASTRTRIEGMEYQRINRPIRLEIPFTRAYRYNYVRVINGQQTPVFNQATEFFYFITEIQPSSPGVTVITVQLDVWTTFFNYVNFGQCFVERGHIGIANKDNFSNFGRDFLTVPEGLDVGNEYQVAHHVNRDVMHKADREHGDSNYMILVASTVNLEADAGNVGEPKLNTAKGDNVQGLPSGVTYYGFTPEYFRSFMEAFSAKPWVTQGIISITAVPEVYRYGGTFNAVKFPGWNGVATRINIGDGRGIGFNMLDNWRSNSNLLNQIPPKYRKLRKFFTYPYMILELTNFAGGSLVLKPELWNDPHAWMSEKAVLAAPNQRIMHWPVKYNAGRGSTRVDKTPAGPGAVGSIFEDNGEYMSANITTTSLPTFALVNNGYLAFMANNAHGIAQQFNQADWSQQRALQANAVSYDQANSSIQTGASNALVARNADAYSTIQGNENAGLNALLGGVGSIGRGIAGGPAGIAGGAASAAMGAAGAAVGIANSNAQWGIRNGAAVATQGNTQANQQYLADSNRDLANWAARGDYAQSIGAINAKLQDARMTQPTVSGTQGGDTFNFVHGGMILSLRFKMLDYNHISIIGDYWLRYGYAINRFLRIDQLSVMTNFTYWKMSELYLVNTLLPEFIKQAIRGIFEKGVTVHANAGRIGVIDISDNEPLSDIVIPVDPDPEIIPPVPEPLNPNLDEVDKMYLVQTTAVNGTANWGVGKEYLNHLNTTGTSAEVAKTLTGVDFVQQTSTDFANTLKFLNIPTKYSDLAVFLGENPDGTWSKSDENADALDDVQATAAANQTATQTTLTQILELVSPPDSGSGVQ